MEGFGAFAFHKDGCVGEPSLERTEQPLPFLSHGGVRGDACTCAAASRLAHDRRPGPETPGLDQLEKPLKAWASPHICQDWQKWNEEEEEHTVH